MKPRYNPPKVVPKVYIWRIISMFWNVKGLSEGKRRYPERNNRNHDRINFESPIWWLASLTAKGFTVVNAG